MLLVQPVLYPPKADLEKGSFQGSGDIIVKPDAAERALKKQINPIKIAALPKMPNNSAFVQLQFLMI